jgi:hypothetical protein
MTEEQQKEFVKLAEPLMKYLAENHNPHTTVIINSTHSEIVGGQFSFTNYEFVKD